MKRSPEYSWRASSPMKVRWSNFLSAVVLVCGSRTGGSFAGRSGTMLYHWRGISIGSSSLVTIKNASLRGQPFQRAVVHELFVRDRSLQETVTRHPPLNRREGLLGVGLHLSPLHHLDGIFYSMGCFGGFSLQLLRIASERLQQDLQVERLVLAWLLLDCADGPPDGAEEYRNLFLGEVAPRDVRQDIDHVGLEDVSVAEFLGDLRIGRDEGGGAAASLHQGKQPVVRRTSVYELDSFVGDMLLELPQVAVVRAGPQVDQNLLIREVGDLFDLRVRWNEDRESVIHGARRTYDSVLPPIRESVRRAPRATVVGVDLPLVHEPSVPLDLVAGLDVFGVESVEGNIDSFVREKSC